MYRTYSHRDALYSRKESRAQYNCPIVARRSIADVMMEAGILIAFPAHQARLPIRDDENPP